MNKKTIIYLVLLCLSLTGVIIANVFGIFKVCVLPPDWNIGEFIFGFFLTLFFLVVGAPFMDYEGRGTPTNMLINGLFYFFIVCFVVFLVLFITSCVKNMIKKYSKTEVSRG